jgi:hypothetical protein
MRINMEKGHCPISFGPIGWRKPFTPEENQADLYAVPVKVRFSARLSEVEQQEKKASGICTLRL